MIVVLPKKDAEAICDAIRAKGFTADKLTSSEVIAYIKSFMSLPHILNMLETAIANANFDPNAKEIDSVINEAEIIASFKAGVGSTSIQPDLTMFDGVTILSGYMKATGSEFKPVISFFEAIDINIKMEVNT